MKKSERDFYGLKFVIKRRQVCICRLIFEKSEVYKSTELQHGYGREGGRSSRRQGRAKIVAEKISTAHDVDIFLVIVLPDIDFHTVNEHVDE